jgi:alcohol dehydrogenase class IV
MATETHRRAFPNNDIPYISYGIPFPEACANHVKNTFHAVKVYIIASGTLAEKTDALSRLKDVLGPSVAGVRVGMKPHTYWSEVLVITEECRRCGADLLITLGAGSLTDAAKIVSLVR